MFKKQVKTDFVDNRGTILRPLADFEREKIKNVVVLYSRAGAVRGNHYHKKEEHYEYILSGSLTYYERPANKKSKAKQINLKAGDLIFTPVMVTHTLKFKTDSAIIMFSREPRTKKGDLGDSFVDVIVKKANK